MNHIRDNLTEVNERIAAACARAGRKREEVTLIAVSKTYPAEAVCEAVACGQTVFGENRVQELREKAPAVDALLGAPDAGERYGDHAAVSAGAPANLSWHLIGTLQSNKVKYLPGLLTGEIHSVDNEKLAQEISHRFSNETGIFLEVNMAGEETKMGLAPSGAEALLRTVATLPHLSVRGLMTIAPYTEDAESNRQYFHALRELMERLNALEILPYRMTDLSMGMTGDYAVAIEEGATHVRIGTGIFGARVYT